MKIALRRLSILYALTASAGAGACDGLLVRDAWIREPPPGASAVAAYMMLENAGDRALEIDSLSSPAFAHGMLHETLEEDGQVRMRHVASLPLAPGQRVALVPGALHGMLMQPRAGLPRAGERVEILLGCGASTQHVEALVARDVPASP